MASGRVAGLSGSGVQGEYEADRAGEGRVSHGRRQAFMSSNGCCASFPMHFNIIFTQELCNFTPFLHMKCYLWSNEENVVLPDAWQQIRRPFAGRLRSEGSVRFTGHNRRKDCIQ